MLLRGGVWGYSESTAYEKLVVSVLHMRAELMAWYKSRHKLFPDENLTRVADFTPKMIGAKDDRKLKTKAMETYGLVHFLIDMLDKYGDRIGAAQAARWREAGQMLVRYITIVKYGEMNLPPKSLQVCGSISKFNYK